MSNPSQQHSLPLESADVRQGRILWLPTLPEASATWAQREPASQLPAPVVRFKHPDDHAHKRFYKHPILVLSRPASREDIIHFLPMTTFHNKPIEIALGPSDNRNPNWYLPIGDRTTHPQWRAANPDYKPLRMLHNRQAARPGYVNTSRVWQMQWRDAQQDWAAAGSPEGFFQLTEESLGQVLRVTSARTGYRLKEQYGDPDVATLDRRTAAVHADETQPLLPVPTPSEAFVDSAPTRHKTYATTKPSILPSHRPRHASGRFGNTASSSGSDGSKGHVVLLILLVAVIGTTVFVIWYAYRGV